MAKKTIIALILSIIGLAVLSGCIQPSKVEPTQELKKFSSVQEIKEFLKASAASSDFNRAGWSVFGRDIASSKEAISVPMGMPAPTPTSPSSGASEYSRTNIQVEGVDEADFVKNDGKYIYVLTQDKLVIVDAYPAEKAKILSETKIPGRTKNLFINDDKIIVFTENEQQVPLYPEYEYRPIQRYTQNTSALIYDVSDRIRPRLVKNYDINGNYFQSRMIGDYVYFIVKDSVYYYADVVDVPTIKSGSEKILAPEVYYFDNPEENYVFHTIVSINLKSGTISAKSFLMGYSNNLYVSRENIYITYQKNLPFKYYQEQQEERFHKVVVPQLPKDTQNKINHIRENKLDSREKWSRISTILEETYNRMDEKSKQDYLKNVEKAIQEYEVRMAQEREKTIIQKIKIDEGEIKYETKGEVPGTLLNQFSMDESGDYFRIATTTQFWTRDEGSMQYNNVYVMDEDLSIIGRLEKIATDERIYSTRFIGNRLYMVTFKRIDPLFVIDLSNPNNPKILGELKIPGFSDYLHPYDENHIIGVGKETGDNEWGGVSIKGVKLSLFDVSDVENPKQIDSYVIGKAGTDSEALRDHKAFLFDKKKNLLVIPIREVREQLNSRYGYKQRVWQGAYVFGATPEDGFKLRGTLYHLDDYEEQDYYWNSPSAVRRSLYIDDVLYTVSTRKILMNSIKDIIEINSIDLPFDKNKYHEYGWN